MYREDRTQYYDPGRTSHRAYNCRPTIFWISLTVQRLSLRRNTSIRNDHSILYVWFDRFTET